MFLREKAGKVLRRVLRSVNVLLKWLLIGSLVGILVGTVSALFGRALLLANQLRAGQPWLLLCLPAAGLLIVFLYRLLQNSGDRGTNLVIASIHSSADIPFRTAPLIFISTVLTQLCGGSAGREGAAIQLGGSIANRLGKILGLNENDQHLIIMCGMSAGFSALFGAPLAATIFALEVISVGIMHYSALVPCVTAALMAHFMAEVFGLPLELFPVAAVPAMTPVIFFKMVAFAAVVGGVSILFCLLLHGSEHLYKKLFKNSYLRIAVGVVLVVLLAAALGTGRYLGTGMSLIEGIFHESQPAAFYDFALKMLFTALTLGAGFKGGEIVPSFCIGAAFGCAAASLLGLPMELVAACGMVGLFCGVTNCPISSLLISFELFGFAGMPYYLTTVAVSYMFSGYYGLYRAQKIMYSKTETHFINTTAR